MADFAGRGEISVPLTLTRGHLYNLAPLIPILDRFLEAAAPADKWRQLKGAVKTHAPAIGDAFVAQGDALAKEGLTQASWLDAWDGITDETVKTLLGPVQNAAAAGLTAGGAAMAKQFTVGAAFNLKNPRAVKYLKAHGAALITDINATTRARIATIVADGAEQGLSYTEVGNLIAAEFEAFAPPKNIVDILLDKAAVRSRAEIVAIQELSMAYEAGNAIVVDDLVAGGLVMEKKWQTANDGKVDQDICAANQAQGWIPYADDFQSGHATAPGHVICRCATLHRRKPR